MKKDLIIIGAIALLAMLAGTAWTQYQQSQMTANADVPMAAQQDTLRYAEYSPELFARLGNQRRVLFFKANWCGTCTQADEDISQHTSQLPANLTVLKVDFDRETDLRTKYGVTVQHTFVEVDSQGQLVKIWNGGGVDELVAELS